MNQTFKQKAIVAAITAVLAVGAGTATTQAFANQFEATTNAINVTAGVAVSAAGSRTLGAQQVVTSENIGGAVTAGDLVYALDNNAVFRAVKIPAQTAGAGVIGVAANAARTINFATNGSAAIAAADASGTITFGGVTFTVSLALSAGAKDVVTITNNANVANTTLTAAAAQNGDAATPTLTSGELAAVIGNAINSVFAPGSAAFTGTTASGTTSGILTVSTNNLNAAAASILTVGVDVAVGGGAATMAKTIGGTNLAFTNNNAPTKYIDATNKNQLLVPVTASTGTAGQVGTVSLQNIVIDTTSSTVGSPVNVQVSASSTSTGVTTGVNQVVATVGTTSASVTAPTTAKVANVVAGITMADSTLPAFVITEGLPGSITSTLGDITLTLKNGYAWQSSTASGKAPQLTITNTSTVGGTATAAPTLSAGADGTSNAVAKYTVSAPTTGGAGVFNLSSGAIFVPTGSTAPVVVTVTVKNGSTTLVSQDVTLANIVAKGVTTSLTKVPTTSTTYTQLFTGRIYNSATAIADRVELKETSADALTNGSTLTLSLSNGVTFTSDNLASTVVGGAANTSYTVQTNTVDGFALGTFAVPTTNKSNAVFTIAAGGADASVGDEIVSLNQFNTIGATTGDLTVTATSNSGGSAAALKIAEIKNASSASVNGSLPTVIPGAVTSVALPDVVISESVYGALNVGTLSLQAPLGVSFDTSVAPTVTVTNASGTAVTGKVTAPTVSNFVTFANAVGGSAATVGLAVAAQSSSTDGPLTIKISGLKATASTTVAAGDLKLQVHGSTGAATAAPTAGDDAANASLIGAAPTAGYVKVGVIGSTTNPTYPTATVADQTKAVIAGLPLVAAGNDQGKPGAVFVAVVYQGSVFFLAADGTWSQFTSAAAVPAYFTGTLGTTTLDIVKTALDLTPIKGAQIVAGYGLGIAGLSSPFDDFIKNSRYNVVYTVK